jgi:hypothetical protein
MAGASKTAVASWSPTAWQVMQLKPPSAPTSFWPLAIFSASAAASGASC